MIAPTVLDAVDFARDRDLKNVRVARRWVRELLGAGHPALYGVVQCLSEFVTNSFQHTDSKTVSVAVLSCGSAIRVEVTDAGSPGKGPHLRGASDNDKFVRGRGLHLVNGLTGGRWGSWVSDAGRRTTWCEVAGT